MSRCFRTALVALACSSVVVASCQPRPRTWTGSEEGTSEISATTASPRKASAGLLGELVELDLSRGAPEIPATSLLGGPPSGSYFQLVNVVREAIEKSESAAIFVRFGSVRLGWSRAEELGRMLMAARQAGKPVICHADGYSNSTAWVAARGCERIWVSPAGGVDTTGIAAQVIYANRLLTQKLGVQVDMLQVGKFKGAEESYTRDGPSPEARESLESTLGAIREAWLQGFEGRGQGALQGAEDGPFSPKEAARLGLVDAVGYLDEAREDARQLGDTDHFRVGFGPSARTPGGGFAELLRTLAGGGSSSSIKKPHVAVVRAVGAITMERSGGLLGERSGITERGLSRVVRELAEDASAKAVVLRIDSPGGSALASDLLWHELMKLREQKPIVVSIGDMAASGGYYLASTGNKIVAERTSIVGSIGVVGGKLAFGNALEQFGVHVETFSPSPNPTAKARAAYESPLVAWDEPTRERVRASMESVYSLFVERVAKGRGVAVEEIAKSAEGRIFAGDEARKRGLVDEWGGTERAIELAKELGQLRPDAPVRVVSERSGLLDLFELEEGSSDEGEVARLRRASALAASDLKAAALRSLAPEASAFLESAEPLLQGERILTALPFAVLLR